MFREIRTREKVTDRFETEETKKELGFMKIKPETESTLEEIEAFWRAEFDRVAREASEAAAK